VGENQQSTFTKRNRRTLRRTVAKNHTTTAAQVTADLNIHLEDTVSTKTDLRELHKSNIRGRAAITKPLVTEGNAPTYKQWCHDNKTWT
jgi:hypothetical protein